MDGGTSLCVEDVVEEEELELLEEEEDEQELESLSESAGSVCEGVFPVSVSV